MRLTAETETKEVMATGGKGGGMGRGKAKNKLVIIMIMFRNLGRTDCKIVHANHRNCRNKNSPCYPEPLV